jgi:hypothetical protein
MTTQECKLFWKPFIRKYGDKVQEHFGAEAFVRQFGGAPGAFAKLRLQKLEMMKPDIVAYNESPPFQILLQI